MAPAAKQLSIRKCTRVNELLLRRTESSNLNLLYCQMRERASFAPATRKVPTLPYLVQDA
jgi:hypothetical protein